MKIITHVITPLCCIAFLLSNKSLPAENFYSVHCIKDGGNEIILEYTLDSYTIHKSFIQGQEYSTIMLPEAVYQEPAGFPDLPMIARSIIIQSPDSVSLEVLSVKQKEEIAIQPLVPSRGVIYRNQNPASIPYQCNAAAYSNASWYPAAAAAVAKPYILRDVYGVAVQFYPVSYNALKKRLRIAESITVKITVLGSGSAFGRLQQRAPDRSPLFNQIYDNHFVNYPSYRTKLSRTIRAYDGDKMIVITAAAYSDAAQQFVDWKNRKGIQTTLYTYPTDFTGSDTNAIKSFIANKFSTEGISYVLLVGDIGDIPSPRRDFGTIYPSNKDCPVDPVYTLLLGHDLYPELCIGRLSVSSLQQARIVINKILAYEMYPDTLGTWYDKACGIASSEGSPADHQWLDNMRTQLLAYGYASVDQLYENTAATNTMLSNSLNSGRGWVHYMGHGDVEALLFQTGNFYFTTTEVAALTNTRKTPIFISVACLNGKFNAPNPCLAEKFLLQGTESNSQGAVAFLGSSIIQAWTPPQIALRQMIQYLVSHTYNSLGAIIASAECTMLDDGDDENTFCSWTLFGDPSMQPITRKPISLSMSSPAIVYSGYAKTVSIDAEDSTTVCLYNKKRNLWVMKNAVAGKADFTIDVPYAGDTVLVTGTKRNKVPYLGHLVINSTPITTPRDSSSWSGIRFYAIPNPAPFEGTIDFKATITTNCTVTITVFDALGSIVYAAGPSPVKAENGLRLLSRWSLARASIAPGSYRAMLTISKANGSVENLRTMVGIKYEGRP
ncbi:MAG: hypothetical protein JW795_16970 [Chitinivibrionales bacterium]|nr:hypothetical protein [Chitinivibrionales bacterium]